MDSLLKETLSLVKLQMGTPTEHIKTPERYVWNSMDGSGILVKRAVKGFWSINYVLIGKRSGP